MQNQDPPQDQVLALIDSYNQARFQQALNKAAELLQKFPNLFPNSFILYSLLGGANENLGQLDAAIDSYKQALKIRPDYAEGYYIIGNHHSIQNKWQSN